MEFDPALVLNDLIDTVVLVLNDDLLTKYKNMTTASG